MNMLIELNIDTQKDQIIARLLLQKLRMYIEYTEGWLDDGIVSKRECEHIISYAVQEDKLHFKGVYEEVLSVVKILK